MATTTAQRVRDIAAHLSGMSDPVLQGYIDDAYQDVIELYKVKREAYHERLTRYLAAHMASLNVRRATSQKVSDMSKTYASRAADEVGLRSTEYGQEFLRLLSRVDGPGLPLVVV